MQDGHSPINLPEANMMDVDVDESIEEEKIYSICAEGKKTKIHAVELYGFFVWNLSSLLFLGFLIWCYVPTSILNSWGIYYIPNKYYAVAVPTWFFMTIQLVVQLYCAIGMIHCHPKDSYKTMQDYASILSRPKDLEAKEENTAEVSNNNSPTPKYASPRNHQKKGHNLFAPNNGVVRNRKGMSSSSNLVRTLRDSKNPYGRKDNDELNINYFAKIPDIVELPITVVNNVLYSRAHWK